METRKIAIACAIGGAFGALIAVLLSPAFWWVGLLAGFMAGYLAYEFRQTLRAIPVAFRAAVRGGDAAWQQTAASIRAFFSEPQPFVYGGILFGGIPVSAIFVFVVIFTEYSLMGRVDRIATLFLCVLLSSLVSGTVFTFFAVLGARTGERCFWSDWLTPGYERLDLLKAGYQEKPLTYANAARWTALGVWSVFKFFTWTIGRFAVIAIAIGVWFAACFCGRFLRAFVNEIRSNERLACGLFAMLGTMASYALFASFTSLSFSQQAACVACGGLFGAFFGVVGHKILARLLPYVPSSLEDEA